MQTTFLSGQYKRSTERMQVEGLGACLTADNWTRTKCGRGEEDGALPIYDSIKVGRDVVRDSNE